MKKHWLFAALSALIVCVLCFTLFPTEAKAAQDGLFTYEIVNDKAIITDCDDSASGEITVPETLGGYPVTTIDEFAFAHLTNPISVNTGNGVTTISNAAFLGCYGLQSITLGDSVESVDVMAFEACDNLQSFALSANNPNYSCVNGVLYNKNQTVLLCAPKTISGEFTIPGGVLTIGEYAFDGCANLTDLIISDNVTTISDRAFNNCMNLSTVKLGSSVATIGNGAFLNCSRINKLVFPVSVTDIKDYAFFRCSGLTEIHYIGTESQWIDINIGGNNDVFNSATMHYESDGSAPPDPWYLRYEIIDGGAVITACDSSIEGNLELPATLGGYPITGIGDNAFCYCQITDITLPETLETIGNNAFGWTALRGIYIPAGVHTIGQVAFQGCSDFTGYTISQDNPFFSSDAYGVLFNEPMTALISAPCGLAGTYYVPDTVTTIPMSAFTDCEKLENLYIPQRTTNLAVSGGGFFRGCTNLQGVWVDSENPTYRNDEYGALLSKDNWYLYFVPNTLSETYRVPDGVVYVDYAFDECAYLNGIYFPEGVRNISADFSQCISLKRLYIPASLNTMNFRLYELYEYQADIYYAGTLEQWDSIYSLDSDMHPGNLNIMYNCDPAIWDLTWSVYEDGVYITDCSASASGVITVPDTLNGYPVVGIEGWAFQDCDGITEVHLPDSVTYIGINAFAYCGNLTTVTMGDNVTTIGSSAFTGCTSLSEIDIPDGITTIEDHTFDGCESLTNIVIPDGVAVIRDAAFARCSALNSIEIPGSVSIIGDYAFTDCTSLTNVVLPYGVTEIGQEAFKKCTSLKSISLPESLTIIGSYAFKESNWLKSIVIPNSVTEVGAHVFEYCSNLETAVIGSGLTRISNGMFWANVSLKNITIPATVTDIDLDVFYLCNSLTDVYYRGTQAQKQNIAIEDPVITAATWHYNSCIGSADHNMKETVVKATATADGTITEKCDTCGAAGTATAIPRIDVFSHPDHWFIYDGTQKSPTLIIWDREGNTLTQGKDYTITYPANRTEVGVYTLTVTFIGNYSGSKNLDFEILPAAAITTQPKTQTVKAGATIKLSVKATGTSLEYQWQSSSDGKTWKNCSSSSATKATFSFTGKTSHNGNYYRCMVTDMAGNELYTSAVRTYVLGVTTQPKTQTVKAGATVKFTVKATGTGLKYQWQSSTDGKTWKNCSSTSAKKATFSFASKSGHNGNYYRCKITDSAGNVVYTASVRVYVLGVTTQPKTQKAESGDTVKFTVKATGSGLKYQWQVSSNGKTWKNCSSTSAKKATFSFTGKTSHDGNYYRCKIIDAAGNVVYSDTVRLYVLGITQQPVKKTVTKGKTVKFSVEATGHNLKYQWQVSTNGGKTFKNCSSSAAKKATFSFATKATHNGNYYRCKITDSAGNVIYTNKVKLTVKK